MAKFGSYFGLCPLIENSLLGISEDFESENVIVTLGKNIAMKYRLVDQNQLTSWTTKETFTSPVIFDEKRRQYLAVFNSLFIKCWGADISNVDAIKRAKFRRNIKTVISIEGTCFVIFKNGYITSLDYALENHKTLEPESVIDENEEYIQDTISCNVTGDRYIGLLIGNLKSGRVHYLLWTCFDSMGNKSEYIKLSLKSSMKLISCCFKIFKNKIQLLTLWDNGRLYIKWIEDSAGHFVESFCVIKSISCKNTVSMVSLDNNYIALYGAKTNDEGGLLIIYNMRFQITQCMQPFKLQSMGMKLCKINDHLFVPVGQNLAVVPYYLEKPKLSVLLGVNSSNNNNNQMEKVIWTKSRSEETKVRRKNSIFKEYLDRGCSESIMFRDLLPKFIEQNNLEKVKHLLDISTLIPENCFATLLSFVLELSKKKFNSRKVDNELYPDILQPLERFEILKLMIEKSPLMISNMIYWRMQTMNIFKFFKLLIFFQENECDYNFLHKIGKLQKMIFQSNPHLMNSGENYLTETFETYSSILLREISVPYKDILGNLKQVTDPKSVKNNDRDSKCLVEKIDL